MPPPKPHLLFALLLVAPLVAAQDNLGALLDLGATRMTGQQFRRNVVQNMIVGTTPSGGTIEIMYAGNRMIMGLGTASAALPTRQPVYGTWETDNQDRVCVTMSIGGGGGGGGTLANVVLPRRCQFWFKLGESYYLAESDSDRHARILRRTVATASTAPAPVTAATLPRALKGSVVWTTGATASRSIFPLSLSIATVTPDGTFEGVVTLDGEACTGREVPVVGGALQSGKMRFRAPMGARCELSFDLTTGREHLLEGSVENTKGRDAGASPMRVWLDASR